jgi:hypothetical protein
MNLSTECVLIYVLRRSGCLGRLTFGRVERQGSSGLNVFDYRGNLIEYISGDRTRSWCLLGRSGAPLADWCQVHAEDALAIQQRLR